MSSPDSGSIKLDASCLEALFRRLSLDEMQMATRVCTQWRNIIEEKVLPDLKNRKSLIFIIHWNPWIKLDDPSKKPPTVNARLWRKIAYPVPGGPLFAEHSNQLVVCMGYLNSVNARVLASAIEWMAAKMPSLEKIDLVMHHNHAIQAYEFVGICDQAYQPKKLVINEWSYGPACCVQGEGSVEARVYPNEARR